MRIGSSSARNVSITVTGSADARITALDALQATVVGSGDVFYAGEPELVSTVVGSGDIKHVKKAPKKTAHSSKPTNS